MGWYRAMLAAARRAATDPALGLVLVHWPVPHPPGIYSRAKDALEADGESSYIDNLRLVDRPAPWQSSGVRWRRPARGTGRRCW